MVCCCSPPATARYIAWARATLTALLAPTRPMRHALAGGVLGVLANLAGLIATWNAGPQFGPHWYPIALTVLALPSAWAGGFLRERQIVGGQDTAISR